MRIHDRILLRLAARNQKKGNAKRALYWYEKLGERRMEPLAVVQYAALLHGLGHTVRGLQALGRLLSEQPIAAAYERRARIYHEIDRPEEALADLNEAIRLDPAPYAYWYIRAVVLADMGQEEAAARDLNQALRRADRNAAGTVHYELGNIYFRMQRYEQAIASYRVAVADQDRVVPLQRFRLGEALEAAGRIRESLAEVRLAAEQQTRLHAQPDQGLIYYRRRTGYSLEGVRNALSQVDGEYGFRQKQSRLHERLGEKDAAMAAVEQGLAQYPDAEELLNRKGGLLRDAGHTDEALAQFDLVIARYPNRLPAYMEKCAIYRKQESWPQALAILEQAGERFPDNTVVRFWHIDVLRDAGHPEEAWRGSRRLTELEPEDPLNWKQQAELAIDTSRFDQAEEAYTKALELDRNSDFYMRRSFSRYMADRYEEAMLDIQAAVEADASLAEESRTAFAMGEIYLGMDNKALAEEEFGRAIRLEPDNALLYERRARCRLAMEKLEEARDDCDAGLALDARQPRMLRLRGIVHYRMGDYEAALSDCRSYAAAQPGDAEGEFNLGAVLARLDRNDEAIEAYSRSLALSPFEAQTYLERASLFYHRLFDRTRAADDLAQWLLYAGGERSESDRLALLHELDGFDDELRELAKTHYLNQYGVGAPRYLN
ncbi:tetratricopeptide repeat protein [Cohnella nanjingensis]|uniref:Tetratricopeptide repeat protein n=1 Tax=Cohnella nanjingensis TaxID=1387779 RepID=A0A7X0RKK5_9BACL|nr:tetratricopeptide repeat protein [Cohnella nanjingensis]MBB6669224.1 tetratricopeptide repeat protein [Cohnella nanjingensis]